jgi:hypothetical protein
MKVIELTNVKPASGHNQAGPFGRAPGLENFTGHIDDGSETGACGKGGCGFRTKYIPWITCSECWVIIDWGLESGLLIGSESGITQVLTEAEKAELDWRRDMYERLWRAQRSHPWSMGTPPEYLNTLDRDRLTDVVTDAEYEALQQSMAMDDTYEDEF